MGRAEIDGYQAARRRVVYITALALATCWRRQLLRRTSPTFQPHSAAWLRPETGRDWRRLTQHRDRHAAVGRDSSVIGEQRLRVSKSDNHRNARARQPIPFQQPSYRVGTVGGQLPWPVAG